MVFVPRVSLAWRAWRCLVRTHVAFFCVPPKMPNADVLKLCDLPAPFPGLPNDHRSTIQIELSQREEELWAAVVSSTRKMIRSAQRAGIVVENIDTPDEPTWTVFLAAYRKLWKRKTNAGTLGVGQLRDLMAQGQFAMSRSRDADGNTLSWHVYVKALNRARLHTTISDMDPTRDSAWNNHVGRAHRLHHWQDMLRFKQEGVSVYDLGGVYRGTEDKEQVNIARFKQSFGGHFADSYNAVVPLTWRGRVALSLISHIGAEARSGAVNLGAAA